MVTPTCMETWTFIFFVRFRDRDAGCGDGLCAHDGGVKTRFDFRSILEPLTDQRRSEVVGRGFMGGSTVI